MSDVRRIPIDGVIHGTGPGKGVHRTSVVESHDDVIRAILRGMRHLSVPVIPDHEPGTRYGLVSDNLITGGSDFNSEDVFTSESDILHMPLYSGIKDIGFLTPKSLGKVWSFALASHSFQYSYDILELFRILEVDFNNILYYLLVSSSFHGSLIGDRDIIIGQGDLSIMNID